MYLDPKNDRVMLRDKEKLQEVSKKIDLVVGSIDKILLRIEELKSS